MIKAVAGGKLDANVCATVPLNVILLAAVITPKPVMKVPETDKSLLKILGEPVAAPVVLRFM
jgi:hypothetical protein